MTPSDLARVGQALYGDIWQSALAHGLEVNPRTVRRWLAGHSPVPDTARAGMLKLLGQRSAEGGRPLAAMGR